MSLSSYNPNDRYRARSFARVSMGILLVFVILVSIGVGFWLGRQSAAEQIISMHEEAEGIRQQRNVLQDSITELRAEAQTANVRYQQLQEQLAEDIPEGPLRELIALVKQQLEEGTDPSRLSFVIRSSRAPRNCSDPDTRRFVVSTPAYSGPDSSITVGEGEITISGDGRSVHNEKGQPEAWYDPAKPVTVYFAVAGGAGEKKRGTLPLHHSVVSGDREYRFTVEEGSRSFAKVTFDSCDYP